MRAAESSIWPAATSTICRHGNPHTPTLTHWGPEGRWLIGVNKEGIQLHNLQKLPRSSLPSALASRGRTQEATSRVSRPGTLDDVHWAGSVKMWDLAAEDPAATTRTLPDPKAMLLTVAGNGRWLVTTAFPSGAGR